MVPSDNTSGEPNRTAAPPGPAPRRAREWVWWAGLGLFLVAPIIFLGVRSALRVPPAVPPEVSGEHIDPEVRAALAAARAAVTEQPRVAAPWGRYGLVLRAHKFEADADTCFAEAERLDPGDGRWPYYRGLYAEFNGADGIPRGEPLFRRAAAGALPGPAYLTAARLRLAEALSDRGQLDEADALFRDELAANPAINRAMFGRGMIAAARGDEATARALLTAVQTHPAARQKASARLAVLARRSGDAGAAARFQTAASSYDKDEDWPDPFVQDCTALQVGRLRQLARIDELEKAGRIEEAIRATEALDRGAKSVLVETKLAVFYGRLGDHDRAELHAREALKLDPNNALTRHLLGAALYLRAKAKWPREGERDAARALFRECIEHFRISLREKPDNADAFRTLGQALFFVGEKDEAIRQLRLAVACRPERYENHMVLGEHLAEVGERDEAGRVLATAEQLAPPGDPRLRELIDRVRGPKK